MATAPSAASRHGFEKQLKAKRAEIARKQRQAEQSTRDVAAAVDAAAAAAAAIATAATAAPMVPTDAAENVAEMGHNKATLPQEAPLRPAPFQSHIMHTQRDEPLHQLHQDGGDVFNSHQHQQPFPELHDHRHYEQHDHQLLWGHREGSFSEQQQHQWQYELQKLPPAQFQGFDPSFFEPQHNPHDQHVQAHAHAPRITPQYSNKSYEQLQLQFDGIGGPRPCP